jgi:hypothetical protein
MVIQIGYKSISAILCIDAHFFVHPGTVLAGLLFPLDKAWANNRLFGHMKIGTWRSLEAHLNGVQGVRGSNPRVPTREFSG